MTRFDSPLNNVKIASPCPANWDNMFGDNLKRFCGECKLNVYNLSGMSQDEAESLIQNSEGRLCVRFFQRADGSVLTENCPVGWAKVKQRTKVHATAAFSLLAALFTGLFLATIFSRQNGSISILKIPFTTPTPEYPSLMGAVALPSPSPTHRKATPLMGNISVDPKRNKD